MDRLLSLIKGEIFRLLRYKIIVFSAIASLIWVAIIALSDAETTRRLLPTLILMDAGLMSIILLAASYYLERQEGTMQSVLVSPVKLSQVLSAKIVSMVFMSFISFVLVVGSAYLFHQVKANVLLLLVYTFLVVLSHTAIGYVLTLYSKDFMQLLVRYMGLVLVFFTPLLLVEINVIPRELDFFAMLSPTYAGQVLIGSAIGSVVIWKVLFGIIYLAVIALTFYPFIVFRRFQKVAMEG